MKGWTETSIQLPRLKEAGRFQTSELASQSIKGSERRGTTGLKSSQTRAEAEVSKKQPQPAVVSWEKKQLLSLGNSWREAREREKTGVVTNQN